MEKQALDINGKDKARYMLSEAPHCSVQTMSLAQTSWRPMCTISTVHHFQCCFPGGSAVKNPPSNAGDTGDVSWIPGWGRSPRGGNGNPLQYSCLGNPMDRRTWKATVHGVIKSWTQLSD